MRLFPNTSRTAMLFVFSLVLKAVIHERAVAFYPVTNVKQHSFVLEQQQWKRAASSGSSSSRPSSFVWIRRTATRTINTAKLHMMVSKQHQKQNAKKCLGQQTQLYLSSSSTQPPNNEKEDDDDDGWSSSSTSEEDSTDDDGWDDDSSSVKSKSDLQDELRKLQQEVSTSSPATVTSSSSSSSVSQPEEERDLFIPIFAVVSLLGLFGSYGYEMLRLASRGELYLPWNN